MKKPIPGIDVCKKCLRLVFKEESTGKDGLLYHKDCLMPKKKRKPGKKEKPHERYGRVIIEKLEALETWAEKCMDKAYLVSGGSGGSWDYYFTMKAARNGFTEIIKLIKNILHESRDEKVTSNRFHRKIYEGLLSYEFEEWTTEYCDKVMKRKLNNVKKMLAEMVKTNSASQLEKQDISDVMNLI